MSSQLIPPSFLFRFEARCKHREKIWVNNQAPLTPEFQVPGFAALNDRKDFAELRAAWSPKGLSFRLIVKGKSEPPYTNPTRIEASDALALWIDTRNTQNIHRASRFCHRFLFLPGGGGGARKDDQAYGCMLRINRAKDDPKTYSAQLLPATCEIKKRGYVLDAVIPAQVLSGYDPEEHPKLGFFYAVTDLELGWNTWFHGPDFPFAEDPSLWGTLELKR